ncbi:MAG: M23 family metallopeptidase [Candidatus Aminicenantales bacterium]
MIPYSMPTIQKGPVIGMAFLFGLAFFGFSASSEIRVSSDNLPFDLTFRALHPGELVLATLKKNADIKRAVIRFQDRRYVLENGENNSKRLAFIGIDLNCQPQSYVMDILVEMDNGRKETVQKEILVSPKEFPVKKMWVKDAFVTPPPEVEERIRLEAELLRIIYSRTTPEWLGEGNFSLPMEGNIAPNFGQRRIYNNLPRSPHSGVDISAPWGTPIKASNSGKVVLARDLYYSGKTVIIDHGLGVFTIYCHLSRISVQIGDLVKKGDVIGKEGSTGRSTGPHLHFGVKIFDSRVDPISLLTLSLE